MGFRIIIIKNFNKSRKRALEQTPLGEDLK